MVTVTNSDDVETKTMNVLDLDFTLDEESSE